MPTSGYKRRGYTTSNKNRPSYGSSYGSWSSAVASTSYRAINNWFKQKVYSYQTLCKQTHGPATSTRPSPATLTYLAKWVEKGAVIYTVSSNQIARWSKVNKTCFTAASAKNALCNRFGKTPIKAVAYDKNGKFLVVTAQTWKGKIFKFPR